MKLPALIPTILLVFSTILSIDGKRFLKIEELIGSPFNMESRTYWWISDTQLAYFDGNNNTLMGVNVMTKQSGPLDGYVENFSGVYDDVHFSDDGHWISIPHDCTGVYTYSRLCNYTILDRTTRKHYNVANGRPTQVVALAPKTNAVVYVIENDIYYMETPDSTNPIRLTTTGRPGIIYNGVCDFIYGDEIFQKSRAFYFSTDGTKLVYLSMDDTNVLEEHFPNYGVYADAETYQYVKVTTIRYPKPGTPIPKVSVHVIDLVTKKEIIINKMKAPVELQSKEHIVFQLTWADDKNVVVAWTNRIQNIMITMMCDVIALKCKKIMTTKQPDGWVSQPTFYFKNSSFFAVVQPQPQKNGDTYSHVTVVSNGIQKALTSGLREVDSIVDYDVNSGLIYYLATNLTNPESIHLYVIPENGLKAEACISCKICGSVQADFSTNFSYHTVTCTGPGLGAVYAYSKTGKFVMELLNSNDVKKSLRDIILPNILNFEMVLADGKSKGAVRLFLPPNLNTNAKYPLLLAVMQQPNYITLTDDYVAPDDFNYMATAMNVIVARFDVRGSDRRGYKLRFAVHKKLGGVDVEDHLFLTKAIMKKYSYIDSKRVGVYGEAISGFTAAMILAKDTENIFTCGMIFSPYTNFKLADAFFTEKFMHTPDANPDGYNYTDLTQLYDKFRGKNLLLSGSTLTRDASYQHTAVLARSLQMNNVPFKFQSVIDEMVMDLGWSGLNTAVFWFNSKIDFFAQCFNVKPESNETVKVN